MGIAQILHIRNQIIRDLFIAEVTIPHFALPRAEVAFIDRHRLIEVPGPDLEIGIIVPNEISISKSREQVWGRYSL
jgi:hypothetical protein